MLNMFRREHCDGVISYLFVCLGLSVFLSFFLSSWLGAGVSNLRAFVPSCLKVPISTEMEIKQNMS